MDDRWAWVALGMVREVAASAQRYADLLGVGTPSEVFRASRRALAGHVGDTVAAAVAGFDAPAAAAAQAALADRVGARLVLLGDPDYPLPLHNVPLPPPFLLVRGSLAREDALGVAIVGSRQASAYGQRTAEQLSRDLATRAVTVVSGLARGVDTAAHRGALAAGGRTLAVLGSGVDVVYPPENRGLAADVVGAGALMSQFPMATPPLPHHFPQRNRVIAGLTLGTVVVEAAARSGALITARFAGELGREVYAVPGNVSSPGSQGTNHLIQDGAKLVLGWADVVEEWTPEWRRAVRQVVEAGEERARGAGAPEGRILRLLGDDPVAVDRMVEQSGLPASQVAAGLTALELQGLARRVAGQHYVKG